ncbi:DUF3800 domain-containing protein [Polaribacter sp.]|nr:DUF3800 domain-containing protein [Polaribacter sp.]
MQTTIHIYCDESSHLENDNSEIMGLGALTCPSDKKDVVFQRIREFKVEHGLKKDFEIKWSKISPSKVEFYIDIINYFFDLEYLGFRSVIINKKELDHSINNSSHDEFYYKMNFLLIRELLVPSKRYRIFLDKKDTRGRKKIEKLHKYLCSNQYDYKKEVVKSVQEVVSDQIELVQLCDLLLGAVSYANRGLESSSAKLRVINKIKKRSGYSLTKNTLPSEIKMNTLIWRGKIKNGQNE